MFNRFFLAKKFLLLALGCSLTVDYAHAGQSSSSTIPWYKVGVCTFGAAAALSSWWALKRVPRKNPNELPEKEQEILIKHMNEKQYLEEILNSSELKTTIDSLCENRIGVDAWNNKVLSWQTECGKKKKDSILGSTDYSDLFNKIHAYYYITEHNVDERRSALKTGLEGAIAKLKTAYQTKYDEFTILPRSRARFILPALTAAGTIGCAFMAYKKTVRL